MILFLDRLETRPVLPTKQKKICFLCHAAFPDTRQDYSRTKRSWGVLKPQDNAEFYGLYFIYRINGKAS